MTYFVIGNPVTFLRAKDLFKVEEIRVPTETLIQSLKNKLSLVNNCAGIFLFSTLEDARKSADDVSKNGLEQSIPHVFGQYTPIFEVSLLHENKLAKSSTSLIGIKDWIDGHTTTFDNIGMIHNIIYSYGNFHNPMMKTINFKNSYHFENATDQPKSTFQLK